MGGRKPRTASKIFLDKTNILGPDDCWTRKTNPNSRDGWFIKNRRAPRVSYELHTGEIPSGLFVCHKCDNPACVNPNHLYAGTHLDNMKDRNDRGRTRGAPKGHPNWMFHQPEEARKKISKANLGRKWSQEARASFSEKCKGRIISSETRRKMSKAGQGKKQTEEDKAKKREAATKRWATPGERAKLSARMVLWHKNRKQR